MSDFHESHRAAGLQGRAQPGHLGVGLTIITVLGQRQEAKFLGFIKQVAGCISHASLNSQISVDASCGQEARQRGREGEKERPTLGPSSPGSQAHPPPGPRPQQPSLPRGSDFVLRPCLPSVARGEHNVSAHLLGTGGPPCSSACAQQGRSALPQSHSLLWTSRQGTARTPGLGRRDRKEGLSSSHSVSCLRPASPFLVPRIRLPSLPRCALLGLLSCRPGAQEIRVMRLHWEEGSTRSAERHGGLR